MKKGHPSLNELEILAGFVSKFFLLFLPRPIDAFLYYQSLTRTPPHPLSLPAKPPPQTMQTPIPVINLPADAEGEEHAVSGERQAGRKLSIKGQHERQRRKRKDSSPLRSGASTPVSTAEDGPQASTMKRVKTAADEETPSLLLRMGRRQQGSRNTSKSRSSSDGQSQRSNSPRRHGPPPAGLSDLSLGISIKGAARSHSSLLERIQGNGT
jgi:hypothetical protein